VNEHHRTVLCLEVRSKAHPAKLPCRFIIIHLLERYGKARGLCSRKFNVFWFLPVECSSSVLLFADRESAFDESTTPIAKLDCAAVSLRRSEYCVHAVVNGRTHTSLTDACQMFVSELKPCRRKQQDVSQTCTHFTKYTHISCVCQ